MRIALTTDAFVPGGGLEHCRQICSGMPDLEFAVFGKAGEANCRLPFDSLANVRLYCGAGRKELQAFRPRLIHHHHLRSALWLSGVDCPELFTVRGIHLRRVDHSPNWRERIKAWLRLRLERRIYRRMKQIIVLTQGDAMYFRTHYGELNPRIIANGVRPALAIDRDGRRALRRKLGWPDDKRVILAVGRLTFPKGYPVLLEALQRVKQSGETSLFVPIAGDGPEYGKLQATIRDRDLGGMVNLLGHRDDTPQLLQAADAYVMSSHWEGMPLALLEAVCAGLPAVVPDIDGCRDIAAVYPERVQMFPPGDSSALATALQASLPERLPAVDPGPFHIDRCLESLRALYFELAGGTAAPEELVY